VNKFITLILLSSFLIGCSHSQKENSTISTDENRSETVCELVTFQAVKLAELVNSGYSISSAKDQLIKKGIQGMEKLKASYPSGRYQQNVFMLTNLINHAANLMIRSNIDTLSPTYKSDFYNTCLSE
jgi:hypothetical protein